VKRLLFHAALYLPPSLALPAAPLPLSLTAHARAEARADRHGDLTPYLPAVLNPKTAGLVEVRTDSRLAVQSVLYRVGVSPTLDVCLAVAPKATAYVAITVWGNHVADVHLTTDMSRYCLPPGGNKMAERLASLLASERLVRNSQEADRVVRGWLLNCTTTDETQDHRDLTRLVGDPMRAKRIIGRLNQVRLP
jgi:hypothetical protein